MTWQRHHAPDSQCSSTTTTCCVTWINSRREPFSILINTTKMRGLVTWESTDLLTVHRRTWHTHALFDSIKRYSMMSSIFFLFTVYYILYSSMTDGVARYCFIFRKDIFLSLQLSSECIVALDKFVCKFCRSQKTGRRTASKSRPNKKRTRSNMSRVNEMITVYRLLSSYRRARRE